MGITTELENHYLQAYAFTSEGTQKIVITLFFGNPACAFDKASYLLYAPKHKQPEGSDMAATTSDTQDRIRQRAYELWEQHGRSEGHEAEFWHQAERELRGEASSSDTSKGVSANAASARSGSGSDGPR